MSAFMSEVVLLRCSSFRIVSTRMLLLPLIVLLIGGNMLRLPVAADVEQSTAHDGGEATTTAAAGDDQELGVEIVEKPANCERISKTGDLLKVHYTGYYSNGTEFDTSRGGRNAPFFFILGGQRVIKGWDLGLVDMCVGEKRRLSVPPHLGYGKEGFGKVIGPNEVLTFDVELIDIVQTEDKETMEPFGFENLDLDNDGLLQRDEIRDYLRKMGDQLEEIAIQMETLQGANDLVDRVMKIHDGNKDGAIDRNEFYTPTSGHQPDDEL